MIGDHLKEYTFDYLLQMGLSDIPDTVDKRQGSPIYDAVASAARLLEFGFAQMEQVYVDTYAQYAAGEALTLRAEENGINRHQATAAMRKGVFTGADGVPYEVPIGARFSTIDGDNALVFGVVERITSGVYQLQCEQAGSLGNEYIGSLLPIDVLSGLETAALSDIIVPGTDAEADEPLRERYLSEKNARKFGGNIDQYREWVIEQDGVAACQVYPVWAGGGTVLISFVASGYLPATAEHVNLVQQALDPTQDGQGLGYAPIDHIVTVTTPISKVIDIRATIQMASGFTLAQLRPLIEQEIEAYFAKARADWGTSSSLDHNDYSLHIFRSQINAAIIRVPGVINVSNLTLAGADQDIDLREDAQLQELPQMGVLTLV